MTYIHNIMITTQCNYMYKYTSV